MSDGTAIEWTDATVNAVNGCTRVSPGCGGPGPFGGCYAERLAGGRLRNHPSRAGLTKQTSAGPRWSGEVSLNEEALFQPLRWARPRRIFWNAHGDLFHPKAKRAWRDLCFAVMALTPQHQHQVLTKRPNEMREYIVAEDFGGRLARVILDMAIADPKLLKISPWPVKGVGDPEDPEDLDIRWPLPNVWLGTSVEDQQRADERVPHLLATPAAVRFLSCEPLLGPVDLSELPMLEYPLLAQDALTGWQTCGPALLGVGTKLDWIIVGGESGPNSRPMHPVWARELRDECEDAGVPFFFKQWGAWKPLEAPSDGHWPTDAKGCCRLAIDGTRADDGWPLQLIGKHTAGRVLDGVEHSGMPA